MEMHKKFLEVFLYLLEDNGLSQPKFAEKSGIPYGTITGWTNRGRLPDYEALVKIADFFDCSLDYLMGRTSDSVSLQSEPKPKLRVDVFGLEKEDVKLLQSVADRLKKS